MSSSNENKYRGGRETPIIDLDSKGGRAETTETTGVIIEPAGAPHEKPSARSERTGERPKEEKLSPATIIPALRTLAGSSGRIENGVLTLPMASVSKEERLTIIATIYNEVLIRGLGESTTEKRFEKNQNAHIIINLPEPVAGIKRIDCVIFE